MCIPLSHYPGPLPSEVWTLEDRTEHINIIDHLKITVSWDKLLKYMYHIF